MPHESADEACGFISKLIQVVEFLLIQVALIQGYIELSFYFTGRAFGNR